MSNIFNQMAKSLIESAHGRIRIYPNGYTFSDKGITNSQGVYLRPTPSMDGRPKSLSLGVRTTGNCPQPPGDYPQSENGGFWVPMKECRKCPHHIKRRRRQPYPCCDVLRKLRAAGPSPIEKMGSIMQEAADMTKKIIGG